MSEEWFVVQTKVNGEESARLNLIKQGFHTYLPVYQKERRHARRTDVVVRPLFPRYLFVRFDVNKAQWRCINSTLGVARLMTQGDAPIQVPAGVVEDIQAREDDSGAVLLAPHHFDPGQALRICRGAFNDMVGLFEKMGDGDRVVLLLNLLGREVRIKTPVKYLEAAS